MDLFATFTGLTGGTNIVDKLRSLFVKEGFQSEQPVGKQTPTPPEEKGYGFGMFSVIGLLGTLITIAFCVAAARLSWCYNSKIGTGTFLSIVYGALCFFFPSFYTTYYAFFLLDCGSGSISDSVVNNVKNFKNLNLPLLPGNNQKGGRR